MILKQTSMLAMHLLVCGSYLTVGGKIAPLFLYKKTPSRTEYVFSSMCDKFMFGIGYVKEREM